MNKKKNTATSGNLIKAVYAKVKMQPYVMRYFNFNANKVTKKVNSNIYVGNCVRFINTNYKYFSLKVYVIFTPILEISAEEIKVIVLYRVIQNDCRGFKQLVINNTHEIAVYRVSQEEWTKLRESVPYVELYRYNPKHLYPKLNGYGDNGQRKVWTSCISAYCTSTAVSRIDLDSAIE